ncbi:hypothetical protein CJU89_2520 [Yarrowia sp. B02]|nr:hypothetical protein CJU89_2520 [Yarrowia sp. B02]
MLRLAKLHRALPRPGSALRQPLGAFSPQIRLSSTIPALFPAETKPSSPKPKKKRVPKSKKKKTEPPAAAEAPQPEFPRLRRTPHAHQMDQLVKKMKETADKQAVSRMVTQRGSQYMDMRLPEGVLRLLSSTADISYAVDEAWASQVLQFVSMSRVDPSTAREIYALLEPRVEGAGRAWTLTRFNARYEYVRIQETLLREKAHVTMVDGLSGELAEQVTEMDPRGGMFSMLQECLGLDVDKHLKSAVLYTMRAFLGVQHEEWLSETDPARWACSQELPDQLYLWMCDKHGKVNVLGQLTELVGAWNKAGKLETRSTFSHVVVRTLIKALMDKNLHTHAVMVSQKNAHLLHTNPVPFLLSQHKLYNMAGPIAVDEPQSLEYLCSVVEKSTTVKSGRLFSAAIKAAENHAATNPELVAYLCGVALSRARQQHQLALLLALVDRHNLEIPPNSLLDAAAYWSKQNIDTALTLFQAFCKTPPRTEHAQYTKATKWKLESAEPLANLIGRLTSKHKAWENPKRLGVLFEDLNSLPEHALKAHFPEISKLYRKVAHSVSQDYVGYTLDGTDFKVMTETRLLTRLAVHLRRQLAAEDKQLYYLRKRDQGGKDVENAEYSIRLLTQMRVKMARKLTALTKEIARRQMVVDIVLAQDICRVLNDGSIFASSLNAWRTYLTLAGIVPADAYDGDGRQTYLFESPNGSDLDCSFLIDGHEETYRTRHVPIFEKPAGSINTLKSLDTIILMLNELTRIGAQTSRADGVHAKQASILNDLFGRGSGMVDSVRNPLFRFKYNQLLTEAYIRAAAFYNPAGGVLVFTNINFASCDGNTWSAVLASCIDEDVPMVYQKALERKLSNQAELHDVYIQRSIAKQDWDAVGTGIENLFAYGKFPSEKSMQMMLANSGDLDICDLLVEVTRETIPVYNKDTSLQILRVLTRHTDNPNEAVDYFTNLSDSVGISGLVSLTEPLSRVSPETATAMVPKLLALVNNEVPIEYLTHLMKHSPDRVFEFARETRSKNTLQDMTVESVEEFVVAAMVSGIAPNAVFRFLMDLRSVASSCVSVRALKTVLLEMDYFVARKEYRDFVADMASTNISLDKLWVAKKLHHPHYGCDLGEFFDPRRLDEIADKGDYLIPNIFDGLYANAEIPCHSVFYNYTTFDKNLRVEGKGVELSTAFEGTLRDDYTKKYTEAFNCK